MYGTSLQSLLWRLHTSYVENDVKQTKDRGLNRWPSRQ